MRWGRNDSVRLPVILRMLPVPGCRPRPCRGPVRQPARAAVPRSAVSRSSCSNGLPSSSRSSSRRRRVDASLRSVSRRRSDMARIVSRSAWYSAGPVWQDRQSWMASPFRYRCTSSNSRPMKTQSSKRADRAQQFLGRPGRHARARHPDHRSQGIAQAFRTPVRSTMDRGHQVSRVEQAGRRVGVARQRPEQLRAAFDAHRQVRHFRLVGIALVAPHHEQRRVARDVGIDAGLLDHLRIARGKRLDLRIAQRREFHVLDGTQALVAAHHLRDELRLGQHRLPAVGVEAALRDVADDLHFLALVALPQDAAFARSRALFGGEDAIAVFWFGIAFAGAELSTSFG